MRVNAVLNFFLLVVRTLWFIATTCVLVINFFFFLSKITHPVILTGALLAPLCGPGILCGHSQHCVVGPRCLAWKYGSLAFSLIVWLLAAKKKNAFIHYLRVAQLVYKLFFTFFSFCCNCGALVSGWDLLFFLLFYLLLCSFTASFLCSQAYLLSFFKGCAEKVSVERFKKSIGRLCMTPFVKWHVI